MLLVSQRSLLSVSFRLSVLNELVMLLVSQRSLLSLSFRLSVFNELSNAAGIPSIPCTMLLSKSRV